MIIPAKTWLASAAAAVALLAPSLIATPASARAVLVQARAEILSPARLQVDRATGTAMASIDSAVQHQRRSRTPVCAGTGAASPVICTENLFEFE